jgi:hypothetical protein
MQIQTSKVQKPMGKLDVLWYRLRLSNFVTFYCGNIIKEWNSTLTVRYAI